MRLSIDLETFSSVDIKSGGAHAYVSSPDFQILLCAYSFDGGVVQMIDFSEPNFKKDMDDLLPHLLDHRVEKCAYNATFEWLFKSAF